MAVGHASAENSIGEHAKTQEMTKSWSLFLHDAASTHKGKIEDKKTKETVHFFRDKKNKPMECRRAGHFDDLMTSGCIILSSAGNMIRLSSNSGTKWT